MPWILDYDVTILCPHSGKISVIEKTKPKQKFLLKTDKLTISDCPFYLSNEPSPCITVHWVSFAKKSNVDGIPVILDTSSGMCKSASGVSQGSVNIAGFHKDIKGI